MDPGMATDEVTDQIALIEMNRQETQKELGLAAACNQALSKLQELLNQEKEALQANGAEPGHAANIEAVMQHITRVRQLASGGGKQRNGKRAHGQQHQQHPQQHQQHQQPQPGGRRRSGGRNKNRRSMGRRGAR
jgi:hypothetical protein